ncbi:GRIM-19 protein [Trifolium repens]|nr:GRIM-19 protein [Trifolium repens]
MPQEKAPKVVRKIARALGPVLGIRRANLAGAKPPGGGPSWRSGISLTLAIPGFFLIIASVIFTFFRLFFLSDSSSCFTF